MNCKKCGSVLTPGASICNVCGAEVSTPVNNQVSMNNQVGNQTVVPPSFNVGGNPQPGNNLETPAVKPAINIPVTPNLTNQVPSTPVTNTPNINVPQGFNIPAPEQKTVNNVINTSPVNASLDTPVINSSSVNEVGSVEPVVEEHQLGQNPPSVNYGESNVLVQTVENPTPSPQNLVTPNVQTSGSAPVNPNISNASTIPSAPVSQVSVAANTNELPNNSDASTNNLPTTPVAPTIPVTDGEKPKKKMRIGLIVIIVLVVVIVGFFVFQYISLTNEANKIKNNNATNASLNKKSGNIVSEDAYETIAHQDEYYVEYDFDFNAINDIYENDYSIGEHKVKISISTDKTGNMAINNVNQKLNYPVIKIIHSLKSDTLFIVNELFTNDSLLYVYNGESFIDMKSSLNNVHHLENIGVVDNTLEFTTSAWKDNIVYNGESQFEVCQGYTQVSETFPIETTYTFDLKQTSYSSDLLNSSTKKDIKELYTTVCPEVSPTPEGGATTPEAPVAPVEQTPQISTITSEVQ